VEIIKGMLEQDEVPKDFCKLIYDKTMGNPFFVEEVVDSLKEEGIIYREKKKWKIKAVSRIEFPETVKDVIKKRMGLLDGESQRVLTLASFIGKDFTFKALREVTETKEDRLLEILEKMTRAGFVKQSVVHGEDVCSFTDIIVRDVAYEEVSPLRRKKLHGVVGSTLEKVYAEKIDEHLGELALHFLESGDQEKALDYFMKAGEKAAKVYANIEAASYFQSALGLLEKKEDVLREQQYVLEKLGDIQRLVGELDSSMKYWSDAVQLARQLRDEGDISRLHRKMANLLWDEVGDAKRAKEHHDEALKILESKPESVELASLYEDLAHMYYRTGDMTKARSWGEKALSLAQQLNAYEVISNSYASLGTILSFTGNRSKGAECLEKSLKIALDNGHMETALRAYNNLASVLPAEENQRRLECTEKGFELGRKIGHIGLTSFIGTNLAWAYLEMGKLNKALSLAEESLALDRKSNNLPNLAFSLAALGWIHQRAGDWDKSEQYYKESLDLSQRIDEFQQAAGASLILGWLHFNRGEYETARELQEKSIEILKKVGATELQMQYSRLLAWTYLELEEIEKAENLIEGLHKYALERKDKETIASADWLSAMLLRAQEKWDESIEYFEKSLKEWEALDARKWEVYWFARRALCEYARLYVERGQEGDQEKALDLLSQALEIFQNTGAKKDIEKVEATIAYLETGRGKIVERKPVPAISEVVLPDRISTGYADLDDLLSGGLPSNFAVLLMSPSCDERDFLVKRFLESGVRNGEVTFYITIDPGKVKALVEESPTDFYVFVCNPQADKIIKDLPNVFKLKGVENLTDVNIALTSTFRRLERIPRRACIEIVSDVLLQHHAVHTRRWLTSLLPELRSHGFTTLAVMDPGMHPSQEVRALLDLFEGEICIRKGKTKKFLKIEKMANQEYSDSELPLEKGKL
jgi:predicted ATPase/KaiC/GvpD/RAD55 family RecA-like ATPase